MVTIETEMMSDIFTKYHLINLGVDAVIHIFKEAEPLSADSHDHPYNFTTFIIKGWYVERVWYKQGNVWRHYDRRVEQGKSYNVSYTRIHQIIDMSEGGCTTLILPQQKIQDWGFYRFKGGEGEYRQHDHLEFNKI